MSAAITRCAAAACSVQTAKGAGLSKGTNSALKPADAKNDAAKRNANKLSYNLTRELEQLPQKLEQLEARIGELQAKMSHPDFFSQPHDKTQPCLMNWLTSNSSWKPPLRVGKSWNQ